MQKKSALDGRIVRCILFDLGDTLWSRRDSVLWNQLEGASNQRAVALLRKHVLSAYLPMVDDETLAQRLRDSFEEQLRIAIRHNPEVEPKGALAVGQVLLQWGIKEVDLELNNAIFEALRVRIPESRPLHEDVLPTLAALKQRGFLLGVVTNRTWGGEIFQEDLQTLGLLDYFDPKNMAISADLGIRKPGAAIFMHALNALKVAPEHAVMVGDSLRADIVGAQQVGIFSIWKPKPKWLEQVNAHLVRSTSGAVVIVHRGSNQPEFAQGEAADLPPPGLHITDDDYVLARVQSQNGKLDPYIRSEIKPDLIIEHIGDLLEVLAEVKLQ